MLVDLAGLKYTDIVGSSMKSLRALITLLSSVYPNRNAGIVLFNVPWFFNLLWQSIGAVVDPKTREKMILLGQLSTASEIGATHKRQGSRGELGSVNLCSDDPEIVDKLLEFIPADVLPENYFPSDRCTGSADFGQSDEELSMRRYVESILLETDTRPVGVDLSNYLLQELDQ